MWIVGFPAGQDHWCPSFPSACVAPSSIIKAGRKLPDQFLLGSFIPCKQGVWYLHTQGDRIIALEAVPFTVQLALNPLWSWVWLWTLDLSASLFKGTHTVIPSFMFFNLCISVCEYTDENVLADTCETQREPVALDPDAGGAGGYEPPLWVVGAGSWTWTLYKRSQHSYHRAVAPASTLVIVKWAFLIYILDIALFKIIYSTFALDSNSALLRQSAWYVYWYWSFNSWQWVNQNPWSTLDFYLCILSECNVAFLKTLKISLIIMS